MSDLSLRDAIIAGASSIPPVDPFWESLTGKTGGHYNIYRCPYASLGMDALRNMFPDAQANEMNFVWFSTSGVHGSYQTIEDADSLLADPNRDPEDEADVTFLVVQPRLCCLRYGRCLPQSPEDIDYLAVLRQSSWEASQKVGRP